MLVCWYSVADIPCYAVAITDQLDAYLQPRSHSDLIGIITESLTVPVGLTRILSALLLSPSQCPCKFSRVSPVVLYLLLLALCRESYCARCGS